MYEYAVTLGEGRLAAYGVCDETTANKLVNTMGDAVDGPWCTVENGCFCYSGSFYDSDNELYGLQLSKPLGYMNCIGGDLLMRNCGDDCLTGA
jgi:hypothetical protein